MTEDDERGARGDRSRERLQGFGPIDAGALRQIRELFAEREPLVEAASLDDPLNPQTLSVALSDGIGGASTARLDVRWSVTGSYGFHYTDGEDRNFRFDRHPKPDAPTRHFHPPPNAPSDSVEASCITVNELSLVTRAVRQRWRDAYDRGTFDGINDAENPP